MRNIVTGLLFLSLAPVAAHADFLCTYKTYYGLEADGFLGLGTEGMDIETFHCEYGWDWW